MQSNLTDTIKKYDIISFDLYDTLIYRCVSSPDDIFSLVEEKYNTIYDSNLTGFKNSRIIAEAIARRKCQREDISIDMIYSELPYSLEEKERLCQLEENIEVENCVANIPMIELFQYCKSIKKKVIIITDMYLPKSCISKILEKFDLEVDGIFISGEIGLTKRDGTLYEYVMNELKISADKVVHFGDNYNGDIVNAQKKGIQSIERISYPEKNYYMGIDSSVGLGINQSNTLISNYYKMLKDINSTQVIGYSIIGPVMYEFCKWVHKLYIEKKIDTICFMAREGYLIKKCYELLYPNDEISYIRINKNVIRLPIIGQLSSAREICETFPSFKEYTWSQIFEFFQIQDIEPAKIKIVEALPGVDFEAVIGKDELKSEKYDNAFAILKELSKEKIREQTEYLLLYLKECNLIERNVGLVNNSINGVAQYYLQKICDEHKVDVSFRGVQFVKSAICQERLENRVFAWLDELKLPMTCKREFTRNSLIFEHFLFENCGTALTFSLDNGKIAVECEAAGMEQSNRDIVEKIQEEALKFCKDYSNINGQDIGPLVFHRFFNLLYRPGLEEVNLIKNIWDSDSDGVKRLIDNEIEYNNKLILGGKKIPANLKWVEGYLTIKGKNNALVLYNFINILRDNGIKIHNWLNMIGWSKSKKKVVKCKFVDDMARRIKIWTYRK